MIYVHSEKLAGKKLETVGNVIVGVLLFILGGIVGLTLAMHFIADYVDVQNDANETSYGI